MKEILGDLGNPGKKLCTSHLKPKVGDNKNRLSIKTGSAKLTRSKLQEANVHYVRELFPVVQVNLNRSVGESQLPQQNLRIGRRKSTRVDKQLRHFLRLCKTMPACTVCVGQIFIILQKQSTKIEQQIYSYINWGE